VVGTHAAFAGAVTAPPTLRLVGVTPLLWWGYAVIAKSPSRFTSIWAKCQCSNVDRARLRLIPKHPPFRTGRRAWFAVFPRADGPTYSLCRRPASPGALVAWLIRLRLVRGRERAIALRLHRAVADLQLSALKLTRCTGDPGLGSRPWLFVRSYAEEDRDWQGSAGGRRGRDLQ